MKVLYQSTVGVLIVALIVIVLIQIMQTSSDTLKVQNQIEFINDFSLGTSVDLFEFTDKYKIRSEFLASSGISVISVKNNTVDAIVIIDKNMRVIRRMEMSDGLSPIISFCCRDLMISNRNLAGILTPDQFSRKMTELFKRYSYAVGDTLAFGGGSEEIR